MQNAPLARDARKKPGDGHGFLQWPVGLDSKEKVKHQYTGLESLCALAVLGLFSRLPGKVHEQPKFTF